MTLRYFCADRALRPLAAPQGVPPLRFGEHGFVATEMSRRGRGGGRLRNLRRNLDHTIGVNVFFAQLARDARRAGHRRPRWWSEAEATERFSYLDQTYWIRPDGAGIYAIGKRWAPFLVEYDRGTMRARDYERKFAGLTAFYKSGRYRTRFGREPAILVVAEHDAAEQRFLYAALHNAVEFDADLPFFFTTRWRFERDPANRAGTRGPIWRTLDSSQDRAAWLDDPEFGPR